MGVVLRSGHTKRFHRVLYTSLELSITHVGYIFWDKNRLEEWDIGPQTVKEKVLSSESASEELI